MKKNKDWKKEFISLLEDWEIGFGEGAALVNLLDFIEQLLEEKEREVVGKIFDSISKRLLETEEDEEYGAPGERISLMIAGVNIMTTISGEFDLPPYYERDKYLKEEKEKK